MSPMFHPSSARNGLAILLQFSIDSNDNADDDDGTMVQSALSLILI